MPRKLPRYCVEDVDRYGTARIYLRRAGSPKVRLLGTPWSAAFMRAYEDALEGIQPPEKKDPHLNIPGSWRNLCVTYFASPAFGKLDVATRGRRRSSLESTFVEPVKPGSPHVFAEVPISRMTPKAIAVLRDRRAATPEGANNLLKGDPWRFQMGERPGGEGCLA